MVPQKQNNNEIFLQDRAHCMNAVAQIMEMRATGAVPLAYVQTYGCQQNVADGEKIKGQLAEMGFPIPYYKVAYYLKKVSKRSEKETQTERTHPPVP